MMGDLTSAPTSIAERLGEEAVEEAWRYAGETSWKPFFDAFRADGDVAAFAQTFAAFLTHTATSSRSLRTTSGG